MLSWSSTTTGTPADVRAIVDDSYATGLSHQRELLAFADAMGGYDDERLDAARAALVASAGEAFMTDAAAVVANFEMMTRVADGTGARFPDAAAAGRSALDASLGITGLASAR